MTSEPLQSYAAEMRVAKYSPITITDRLELLGRFAAFLDPRELLEATADDLMAFQQRFSHLAPASVNIYSRHLKAFYDWAVRRRRLVENPALEMVIPRVPRGRPHPTNEDDLRVIFACTTGALRTAYTLATFAGLRRGEICRLHRRDLDLAGPAPTALIHGKGGKERIVPLLGPVVDELGYAPRGWVITRDGQPYDPERLSVDSTRHLQGLGLQTTLHSMRHTFATSAVRLTKDPLLVRDILGHASVSTTEIYMDSDLEDAHARLSGLTTQAARFLSGPNLYVVNERGGGGRGGAGRPGLA